MFSTELGGWSNIDDPWGVEHFLQPLVAVPVVNDQGNNIGESHVPGHATTCF